MVYNEQTASVAVVRLARLKAEEIAATLRGLFDDESLGHFEKAAPGFLQRLTGMAEMRAATARELVVLGFAETTVVLRPDLSYLVALPLKPGMDENAFDIAKFAIEGFLSGLGLDLQLDRRGDTVILHPQGVALDPRAHSPGVEDAAITGLQQVVGDPVIAFSIPVTPAVSALLPSLNPGTAGFAALLADATYIGGFLVSGARPELHLYARYEFESGATAAKASYDAAWIRQVAEARTADEVEEANYLAGSLEGKMVALISRQEMARRLGDAAGATVFGRVLLLDLDTIDLQHMTSAVGDRFYRKP